MNYRHLQLNLKRIYNSNLSAPAKESEVITYMEDFYKELREHSAILNHDRDDITVREYREAKEFFGIIEQEINGIGSEKQFSRILH